MRTAEKLSLRVVVGVLLLLDATTVAAAPPAAQAAELFTVPPELNSVMAGGVTYRYVRVTDGRGQAIARAVVGDGVTDAQGIAAVPLSAASARPGTTLRVSIASVKVGNADVRLARPLTLSARVVPKEIAIEYRFGQAAKGLVFSVGAASRDGLSLTVVDDDGGRNRDATLLVGRSSALGVGAGAGAGSTGEGSGFFDFGPGDISCGIEAWALQTRRDHHEFRHAFDGTLSREDAYALGLVLDTFRRFVAKNPTLDAVIDGIRMYLGKGTLPTQTDLSLGMSIDALAQGNLHGQDLAVGTRDTKYGLTLDLADAKVAAAIGAGLMRREKQVGLYFEEMVSLNWNILNDVQWNGDPIVPSMLRTGGQAARTYRAEFLAEPRNVKNGRLAVMFSDQGEKAASYKETWVEAEGPEIEAWLAALDRLRRDTRTNLRILQGLPARPDPKAAMRLGARFVQEEARAAWAALVSSARTPVPYRIMANDLVTTQEQKISVGTDVGADFSIEVGGKYERYKKYAAETGVIFEGRAYPISVYGREFLAGTGNGRTLAELGQDMLTGGGKVKALVDAIKKAIENTGVTITVGDGTVAGKVTIAGFDVANARYTEKNGVKTGTGSIQLPKLGAIAVNFTIDAKGNASGTWSGNLAMPGLGSVSASGVISRNGFGGTTAAKIGVTSVDITYLIGPRGISGSGTGFLHLGDHAFAGCHVTLDDSGLSVTGSGRVTVPGLGSRNFTLSYANGVLSGTSAGGISFGNYAFTQSSVTMSSTGAVTVTGQAAFNLPGVGSRTFDLSYANGVVSAYSNGAVSLGNFSYTSASFAISSNGTLTATGSGTFEVPGIGSRQYSLNYANGVLSASSSGALSLGNYAFTNSSVTMSSAGVVTATGSASFSLAGIGSRTFNVSYANGVLSASSSGGLSLGSHNFTNSSIAISSNGVLTVSGSGEFNIPGVGNRSFTINYANNVLTATSAGGVSLGNYAFTNSSVSMSSSGAVTISGDGTFTIPGLGSRRLTLSYASGTLSASTTGDISLGNRVFSNSTISVSSNGTVSVVANQSINVPVFGQREFHLNYASGTLSAIYSGTTNLAGASRNVTLTVNSGGEIHWRSDTAVKLGDWTLYEASTDLALGSSLSKTIQVLGQNITVSADASGNFSGSYNGGLTVAGIGITGANLTVNNNGVSGSGTIGTGRKSVGSATFSVTSAGGISGSGSVNLATGLSVNVTFTLSPATKSLSGSLQRDASIGGVLANWHFTPSVALSLTNSGDMDATASGVVSRRPKHQCLPGFCPNRRNYGLTACSNDGKETGESQNFGSGSGTVDLASGKVTIHVQAMFGLVAQNLEFDLW